MNSKKNIIFYCPSKILGGVEYLVYRIIKNCLSCKDFNIVVIDIEGGVITDLLKNENSIRFENDNKYLNTIEEKILVVATKCLHELYKFIDNSFFNATIYMWHLGHSGAEVWFLPLWLKFECPNRKIVLLYKKILKIIFFRSIKKVKNFLIKTEIKKSLIFGDLTAAYETFEDVGYSTSNFNEVEVLPLFIDKASLLFQLNAVDNKKLRIGWLGRIAFDFKIYALVKAIDDSYEYAKKNKLNIEFHIVGDGDALSFLKDRNNLFYGEENNIIYYGRLDNEASVNIMLKNVDIVVAMGRSSLDCSKFGIPTIIVNPVTSWKELKRIKYRWIYNSKNKSFGEWIKLIDNDFNNTSLDKLLDEYLSNRKMASKNSYEYAKEYTEEKIFNKFLAQIDDCKYTTKEFYMEFEYFFQQRILLKKLSRFYKPKWPPK
jgi:hypothetical protein